MTLIGSYQQAVTFTEPFFPGAQMNKIYFQKTPVRQGEHIYIYIVSFKDKEMEAVN